MSEWVVIGPPVRGRACGGCQLCCTLVPVKSIWKKANQRCKHQCSRGCAVYDRRPGDCRAYSCRWLIDKDTDQMRRPDKIGYVVDPMLDHVLVDGMRGDVIQVWCDPARPDAHRDPALRAWIDARAMPALIRFSEVASIIIFPPSLTADATWLEISDPAQLKVAPEGAVL